MVCKEFKGQDVADISSPALVSGFAFMSGKLLVQAFSWWFLIHVMGGVGWQVWWCWEPQGSWGRWCWKGREKPCQSGCSAQHRSPSTLIHFLIALFFLVIYKQILWTSCVLERNICSLKYLLYFRTSVIWKMGILRDANKTVIIIEIFLPAIFDQNVVARKTLFFLFMNCICVIRVQ